MKGSKGLKPFIGRFSRSSANHVEASAVTVVLLLSVLTWASPACGAPLKEDPSPPTGLQESKERPIFVAPILPPPQPRETIREKEEEAGREARRTVQSPLGGIDAPVDLFFDFPLEGKWERPEIVFQGFDRGLAPDKESKHDVRPRIDSSSRFDLRFEFDEGTEYDPGAEFDSSESAGRQLEPESGGLGFPGEPSSDLDTEPSSEEESNGGLLSIDFSEPIEELIKVVMFVLALLALGACVLLRFVPIRLSFLIAFVLILVFWNPLKSIFFSLLLLLGAVLAPVFG